MRFMREVLTATRYADAVHQLHYIIFNEAKIGSTSYYIQLDIT